MAISRRPNTSRPDADIAMALSVEVDELPTEHQRELQSGAIKAYARVAESPFRKAVGERRNPSRQPSSG